jgi:hypothetical protein
MKEQKIEKSNFNCQKQLFAEKLKLGEFSSDAINLKFKSNQTSKPNIWFKSKTKSKYLVQIKNQIQIFQTSNFIDAENNKLEV